MQDKVVVLGGELALEGRELLEAAGIEIISTPPYLGRQKVLEVMARVKPVAVVVRQIADTLGPDEMKSGGRLMHIAKHGVGTNDIDVAAAAALGIPVSITTGSNGHSVAEHALMLIMALLKDAVRQDRLIRDGVWDKNQYHGRELRGQHLAIIGFGFIGQTLARMVAPLGMKISAFDPHTPESAFRDGVACETDLDRLIGEADVISLHCPLTEETRHLFDARRIGLMKPSAYLVNTARGEVVDEEALIAALKDNRIAGAGLDSFAIEPPAFDNPLFSLPNTLVSPHVAGVTLDAKRAMSVMAAENILATLRHEELAPRRLAR